MSIMTFEVASLERKAFISGETTRDEVMERTGLNPLGFERLITGETYKAERKKPKKGSTVRGEQCGSSKLLEREARMILRFKDNFTVSEFHKILDGKVNKTSIRSVLNGTTWGYLHHKHKVQEELIKELDSLRVYRRSISKQMYALREKLKRVRKKGES